MDHRNDPLDSPSDEWWEQYWSEQLSCFADRFPAQPSVCSVKHHLKFERARVIYDDRSDTITDTATGRRMSCSKFTHITDLQFHNTNSIPYYVFRLDGTLDRVIEPADPKYVSYPKGLSISLFKNLEERDGELAEELGIKKKASLEEKFVRGSLELTDKSFVSLGNNARDSVYIPELKIIISKNQHACDVITEGHSSQVLTKWLTDKNKLLNVDLCYKLIVFANSESSITELFYTSDGKLFERAFVIRTPVVPPGELYCRINSYSSEGRKYRNKPKTVLLSELHNTGGVLLDHTLVLGLETKAMKEWCRAAEFRNRWATLADIECDEFLDETSKNKKIKDADIIRELRSEIKDLKSTVNQQEEIIYGYKRHAQDALNRIGKPQGKNMSDACKHLEHITEGIDPPKKKTTISEKLKNFGDASHGFFKGIDGIYKAAIAAVGLCTLMAGLWVKFKTKK